LLWSKVNPELWRKIYDAAIAEGKSHDEAEVRAYLGKEEKSMFTLKGIQQADFRKFVPFFKVDAQTRMVYGLVTAELPDAENEVCDYTTTLPYYKALVEEMAKVTDGANICPLREMHQLSAVGKGTQFEPQDATKEILMGFKVVDDDAWKKVEEKVYTGFSQGGDYVNKWSKDGYTYYTAKPAEVSLVDRPCLAAARFYNKADGTMELQKSGGVVVPVAPGADRGGDLYEAVKCMNRIAAKVNVVPPIAGGSVIASEIRKALVSAGVIKEAKTKRVAGEDLTAECFAYVGDPEKTSSWKLPIKFSDEAKTKRHIRNALARFSSTKGIPEDEKAKVKAKIVAAAKHHGIEVTEDSAKAVRAALVKMLPELVVDTKFAAVPAADLAKGMYQVGHLASMLEDLQWMVASTEWERDYEQDGSTVPDDLRDVLETMVPIFISMATEEATELLTAVKAAQGGTTMFDLAKAIAALQKMSKEDLEKASKSVHETLNDMHKAITDHNQSMADMHKAHCEKCMKAHDAHMAAMHGSVEKIRKALGAEGNEQPAGGAETEGAKAAAAAALKKAEEEAAAKKVADDAVAAKKLADDTAAALELAKKNGNEAIVKTMEAIQKSLTDQAATNAKLAEDLKKANEKIETLGSEIPPHGPQSDVQKMFVVPRGGQPSGAATGTSDRSGL
jgi:hypothetical protein